uniref:Uncharacterized protein n=1 Tax=Gopherus evgoodei TaxID=1825980 RepID=A0A8C4VU24_9SAUR
AVTGVIHCRCSRCFSFPSKRRVRNGPRVLTLLSLPEDVLFHVLKAFLLRISSPSEL